MGDRPHPRLSVVVLTCNTRELAHQCVQSILEHCELRLTEVLVLDNASDDGTAASLRERFPALRMIESNQNLGTAAGFNLAMRETREI